MYQEQQENYQRQHQPGAQQHSYSEWDERQQQRFPDSPLAQYEPGYREHYPQRYDGQGYNTTNVGQSERQLSMVAGVALLLHAVISRSRASLITAPLGAALFWRGQRGHCPVYQALHINTAAVQGSWQGNMDVQHIPIQS